MLLTNNLSYYMWCLTAYPIKYIYIISNYNYEISSTIPPPWPLTHGDLKDVEDHIKKSCS